MAEHMAVWKQFVGEPVKTLPEANLAAVHVDQQGTKLLGLEDGIPAPALVRQVDSSPGWINTGVGHVFSFRGNLKLPLSTIVSSQFASLIIGMTEKWNVGILGLAEWDLHNGAEGFQFELF
jgi:hypothetical protein